MQIEFMKILIINLSIQTSGENMTFSIKSAGSTE